MRASPLRLGLLSCAWIAVATPAISGPNAGGVILLHVSEQLVFSAGNSYCGLSTIAVCGEADTRVDTVWPVICFLLAAFPSESSPRLTGVSFGINYNAAEIAVLDWRGCGDFEIGSDWPNPGSGRSVTWQQAQTQHVVEIGWFALEPYTAEPAQFSAVPGPICGSKMADDHVPAYVDPVADHGKLGFFTEGYLPCAASTAGAPVAPMRNQLFPNRPNPASSSTEISFYLDGAAGDAVSVDLEIFDGSGRRVRSLVHGPLAAGAHSASWDGRDDSGREVPNGSYFSRLRVGAEALSQTIAILR